MGTSHPGSDDHSRVEHGGPTALDELITVLAAPAVVLSDADGQLRARGAQGFYLADTRLCSRLELGVEGRSSRPLTHHLDGPGDARFDTGFGATGRPAVRMSRRRTVDGERMTDDVEVHNPGADAVALRVVLRARADLADAPSVKFGAGGDPVAPRVSRDAVHWVPPLSPSAAGDPGRPGTTTGSVLTVRPAAGSGTAEGGDAVLAWPVHLEPGARWSLRITVAAPAAAAPAGSEGPARAVDRFPTGRPVPWSLPGPAATPALDALLRAGLRDVDGLLLSDPLAPGDVFAAAGSPWFFTLFGRDSLWTARLLLPLGTDLAAGTLRALARRQGRRDDPGSEEEPGKIVHEVRPGGLRAGGLDLPPLYYGTVDATALWCSLLHDAWRAGLPDDQVAPLLPNLEAALEWNARAARATGSLAYRGSAGGGLANQGWKDSADGVRWADGSVAERPLALCEVQGYAHAAALDGAALLEAFDRPGATRWRSWAAALGTRFRAAFWVDDPDGRYPAIALDGSGRPVTGPASNMAHLLSTGMLDAAEADLVAARLARPDLDCGRGLRTLSSTSAGFDPLSYHCGSVWPHDTAIAALGLAGTGHHDAARSLAEGLARAATEVDDDRLPELYGGTADGTLVPYPPACRPQAWAAAAGVVAVGLLSGWPLPAWTLPR